MTEAIALLAGGDRETWWTVATSLRFSVFSTLFAILPGVPLGATLFLGRFKGKRVAVALVNAVMAVPTVVVGLFVYSFISRSGPLGALGLLYGPGGVILGQAVLAFPLVAAMSYTGLQKLDPRYSETLLTLGAGPWRRMTAIIKEGRYVIVQSVLAAFGRVTGEVGVSMMLGGNIRWYTRTMTTTIALDASKGEFERALSLGLVLLAIALAVNFLSHLAVRDDR
ncbi:MAG: ABC transporter permease [Spirochaetae bacterium HGW-Spirochaetae-3]|jgi:tungstate transport system permease protein|nr:MAG: ABC transporter permease [Spirochaetae bacterium HGW-Spirochaetae-3]